MVGRRGLMVLASALALGLVLTGCPNPDEWEPRGEVHWVQWREEDLDGKRVAKATFSVTNTGRVAVASVDLALALNTDRETYFLQFQTLLDLLPGKSAYETLSLPYRSPEETGSLAGLRIESVSFH